MAFEGRKFLIITDAWHPQVNGIVRTYETIIPILEAQGHTVQIIHPKQFSRQLPMPGYPEIRLAVFPYRHLKRLIEAYEFDTLHIATEGPLGYAARRYCRKKNIRFSTCFHTHHPVYAAMRVEKFMPGLDHCTFNLGIWVLRKFHSAAAQVMVGTSSLEEQLRSWHFKMPLPRLGCGVLTNVFNPGGPKALQDLPRPIALYVGRVAIEKNIESFLSMPWHGSTVVVGDGPALNALKKLFPNTYFFGKKTGHELASYYRGADVFVFPSKTDTFGMVIIEALSCGIPVAAYPVMGPKDIITQPFLGCMDMDLSNAAKHALNAPGTKTKRYSYIQNHYTWEIVAQQFIDGTVLVSE